MFMASPITSTEPTAKVTPKSKCLARRDAARRNRPPPRAAHHRVDVAVIPHVDRARGAGGDRDAQHGGEGQHRMQMTWRDEQADQAGEHHERHHPRLQQRDPVAYLRVGLERRGVAASAGRTPPLAIRQCGGHRRSRISLERLGP